jgi:3-isopropylmalate/(R)-2-methylmalate dehydratase small subunit
VTQVQPFTTVSGIVAPLLLPNITTDAMSPMIAGQSTSADLGALLFANWRYRPDGSEAREFILNKPLFRESKILLTGPNFGCGSSRERAVWALQRFGIGVVIAPSFADIFYDNAFQNGLLPVTLPPGSYTVVVDAVTQMRAPVMTVDLLRNVLQCPDGREIAFEVPAERRAALLEGFDEIQVILRMQSDIDAFEVADRKERSWIYLERDLPGKPQVSQGSNRSSDDQEIGITE